jgi:hypothetical protein
MNGRFPLVETHVRRYLDRNVTAFRMSGYTQRISNKVVPQVDHIPVLDFFQGQVFFPKNRQPFGRASCAVPEAERRRNG